MVVGASAARAECDEDGGGGEVCEQQLAEREADLVPVVPRAGEPDAWGSWRVRWRGVGVRVRRAQLLEEAVHDEVPLHGEGGDEEVEADRRVAVLAEEGHEEAEADHDHHCGEGVSGRVWA